jgi:hypothetical protein
MIGLNVLADVKRVESFLGNLERNAVRKAAARAINDTLTTLRADGARQIQRAHPALRIADIKRNMVVKRAGYTALQGLVNTTGRPLSMLLFQVRGGQRRKKGGTAPVTAMLGTKRTELVAGDRRAFRIAAYGGEIFVRRSGSGRRVRKLRGPSMPGVFRAQTARFEQIASERWAVVFPSRLQYEIELAKQG